MGGLPSFIAKVIFLPKLQALLAGARSSFHAPMQLVELDSPLTQHKPSNPLGIDKYCVV